MRMRQLIDAGLALAVCGVAQATGTPPGDAYLAGYAAAVLEQRLGWAAGSYELTVSEGRLRLDAGEHADTGAAQSALEGIDGVRRVRLAQQTDAAEPVAGRWFPTAELFRPSIADPKEPRFFISPRHYDTDTEQLWLVEVGYGAVFPVYGGIEDEGKGWKVDI